MAVAADKFAELSNDDTLKMERLFRAMDVFREIDTALPMSYAAAFVLVAMKPGKGATEYAKDLGIQQAVASRVLLEIGQKSRHGGPGLELVCSEADPNDLRTKKAYLTPKGKQLMRKLLNAQGRV